jgi:3-hydroxy-3-methylglutaryl CoA synthase
MVGISAFGGYVPRRRLQRKAIAEANGWFNSGIKGYAKGERSMCNWDEDPITMAVDAARDCLQGERPDTVEAIHLASTTLPFTDRQNAGIIATALNYGDDVSSMDISSSQRAGTTGLINAMKLVAGGDGQILYTAAEKRRAKAATANEMLFGDAAAALLIGKDAGVAELIGSYQLATDFVDHYRGQNEDFDYNWEERWIRDEGYLKLVPKALGAAFEKHSVDPTTVDHFIMPATIRNVGAMVAKKSGINPESVRDNLQSNLGEAGTAHSLVMLVDCLQDAEAGQTIVVVGWGQGCDVLIFKTTDALKSHPAVTGIKGSLARKKVEDNYNKFLAFNQIVNVDRGLRGEVDKQTALTALYRNKETVLGFMGGHCTKCGTMQFPKTRVCVNPNCGAFNTQDDQPFAETPAQVLSWTADGLTFSEDPPNYHGMITFEGGGRLMADFTDVDDVDVGNKMRMTFRIKDNDYARNFTRYFWKATPAS